MPTTDDPTPRPRRTLARGPGTRPSLPSPSEMAAPRQARGENGRPGPRWPSDLEATEDGAHTEKGAGEVSGAPFGQVMEACAELPPQRQTAPRLAVGPQAASRTADRKTSPQGPGGHPPPEAGSPEAAHSAAGEPEAESKGGGFTVRLANFEGPFDLLLRLIAKHRLDVTEVALSTVTVDFMAHIRAMGPDWDLDQATEFLVVAATLLDLKAARLLPAAEVEDEEDLALLEARDLLFARLLQYRAYKEVAAIFEGRWAEERKRYPRTVGLEPHHAQLLPEVLISVDLEGFARLAAKAMMPKPEPTVYVEHIHAPLVSVREQAQIVVARLRTLGSADFRTLISDAPDTLTVVARFLALLELYRDRVVALDQAEALGRLRVGWMGEEGRRPLVTDEFDQEARPDDRHRWSRDARQEPRRGREGGEKL